MGLRQGEFGEESGKLMVHGGWRERLISRLGGGRTEGILGRGMRAQPKSERDDQCQGWGQISPCKEDIHKGLGGGGDRGNGVERECHTPLGPRLTAVGQDRRRRLTDL